MTTPIVLTVKRYRCPHCRRTRASNARATDHISRCWYNPAARGCKTCVHFRPESDACGCEPGCNWGNSGHSLPESCAVGVDLTGRPPCDTCHGQGETVDGHTLGVSECPTCGGDGAEVKPGPITGCPKWAPLQSSTERI